MEAIEKNQNGDEKGEAKKSQDFRYKTIYPGSIDNLSKYLLGRQLTIELLNGKMLTGKLRSFGMFDIILTDTRTGQDVIIMKHGILTIQGDLSPGKW